MATKGDLDALFVRQEKYRDFNIKFLRNPVTNDIVTLSNEDSIKQSVRLLVMTSLYERPFKPKIGTRIRSSLFELFDLSVYDAIKKEILSVLEQYEPRIKVQDVSINAPVSQLDNNSLSIHISYLIEGRAVRIDQTITLQRVR